MKKKLLIRLLISILLIAAAIVTAIVIEADTGKAIIATLLAVGVILLVTAVKSLVRLTLKTK